MKATFKQMSESIPEDWQVIMQEQMGFFEKLPDRILTHLSLLDDDYDGFPIDRLQHSLQTAELATDEYIVCALAGGYIKSISADELMADAYKLAAKVAKHSPVALALTRQMMYRNSAQDHPIEAHKIDSLVIYYASQKDGKEGAKSFLEKRSPDFKTKASTDMRDFHPWWQLF